MRNHVDTNIIKDWTGADAALREMAEINRRTLRAEKLHERRVDALKAELVDHTRADTDRRALLELQLESFTRTNRETMGGKSRKLNFGKVGFRTSTKLLLTVDEATVIELLVKNDMESCIRRKESVDKTELGGFSDADLSKVGAERQVTDTFYYELPKDPVQSTTDAPAAKGGVR